MNKQNIFKAASSIDGKEVVGFFAGVTTDCFIVPENVLYRALAQCSKRMKKKNVIFVKVSMQHVMGNHLYMLDGTKIQLGDHRETMAGTLFSAQTPDGQEVEGFLWGKAPDLFIYRFKDWGNWLYDRLYKRTPRGQKRRLPLFRVIPETVNFNDEQLSLDKLSFMTRKYRDFLRNC